MSTRVDKFTTMVQMLLSELLPSERDVVLARLVPRIGPRSGDVLSAISEMLPQHDEWTMREIKQGVMANGVTASAKEIYNAVGYLTRKGRIHRLKYGCYRFVAPKTRPNVDRTGLTRVDPPLMNQT